LSWKIEQTCCKVVQVLQKISARHHISEGQTVTDSEAIPIDTSLDHDKRDSGTRNYIMALLVQLPFIGAIDVSLYGGALLLLAAFELTVFVRNVRRPLTATLIIMLVLLASGVYDTSLVAFGVTIGEGTLLEKLSFVRYFLHCTAVPFLLVPCAELYRKNWRRFAFIAAGVLAAVDAWMLIPPAWVPRSFAGTLRLSLVDSVTGASTFPIITVGISLVVLTVGWLIHRKSGDNTLIAGGLASFVGNALPIGMVGTLPGALGEFLLFLSVILAERKIVRGEK
jgi:hypothetical protein